MAIASRRDTISTRLRMARLAVALVFFANSIALTNWIARIPDVKQKFNLSDGTLGLVLLCSAVGALIAQPICGWLIGRIGSRRVVIVTLLAFCISASLPGWAWSVPLVMVALFVLGACNGALDVAMNAQAAQVEDQYGQPIMSSFHGLWSVGGLVGALIGGAAAARHLHIGWHLLVVSIIAFVIGIVAIRSLIMDDGPSHEAGAPAFALPPRALMIMGLVAFCVLLAEGAIADWSAVYLRDTLRSTAGVAAVGFAAFSLLMAAGRLSGDWLNARFGPAPLVRGGGVLIVVGMLLALLIGYVPLVIVGFALIGAGISCVFPLLLSAAARTPGVAPGTGIAAIAATGYTGFLVGPPLIGSLAELTSLRIALGTLVVVGALVVVFGGTVRGKQAGASSD